MKKKVFALIIAAALGATLLGGCNVKATMSSEGGETVEHLKEEGEMVYMGGLKAEGKDLSLCIWRSGAEQDLVIIIDDAGEIHYGMDWSTEDATTSDGRTYSKVSIEDVNYGYYFNDDLTTGILVDKEENVYEAGELTEDEGWELVAKTL